MSDETGTNVYANVKGKITKFTLKDGIPSKTGEEYGLLNQDGTTTNTTAKLVAAKGDKLVGYDNNSIHMFKKINGNFNQAESKGFGIGFDSVKDVYVDSDYAYFLSGKKTYTVPLSTEELSVVRKNHSVTDTDPVKIVGLNGIAYVASANGKLNGNSTKLDTISGLSISKDNEILVSSVNTNAYTKFTLDAEGALDDKETIQTTLKEGIKKVIDNREKNGTLLFVTKGGIERQ